MPAPYPAAFPALYLYPLNDSFIPKHISLLHNQRVKIGRQTNAKTAPGERNGYFDSKVLSRQHAEVWEESGKIFIKDVKSSNGTFINGERLSAEGVESEPFELKSDDIVEFGIDIVGEDNKTVVHHKVAARVACILSEQDAQTAARAEQHHMQHLQQQYSNSPSPSPTTSLMGQPGPNSAVNPPSAFPFSNQQQRRPPIGHQGLAGMGGMGGSMRPPGKSGLTFDHILSRLQGELQKSRETGAELHTLNGAMHEVQDTLGGGLPQNIPSYPHNLPPVRQQQGRSSSPSQAPETSEPAAPMGATAPSNSALLSELQNQLRDNQASLALHVEKIRTLEAALKEQEAIRHEVRLLRDMVDAVRRKDVNGAITRKRLRTVHDDLHDGFEVDDDEDTIHDDEDLDDSMSISTVMPHQLERVDEEDEEQLLAESEAPRINGTQLEHEANLDEGHLDLENEVDHEERRRRRDELGRPRTPEPGMGMGGNLYESRARSKTLRQSPSESTHPHLPNGVSSSVVDDLTARLASLSSQLESALELSSTLQAQHATAQSTISALESKVDALEGLVKLALGNQRPKSPQNSTSEPPQTETLTSMINDWKKSVEGQWSSVQEEWSQERERLSRAREEWESKARLVDSGLEKLERMQRIDVHSFNGNGDARDAPRRYGSGLATPPSPRSLSADSNRPRRRKTSSRGRARRSLSRGTDEDSASLDSRQRNDARSLATPEPSVRTLPSGFSLPPSPKGELTTKVADDGDQAIKEPLHPPFNVQTAVGVLVLSIAAAAVVWRVKPE